MKFETLAADSPDEVAIALLASHDPAWIRTAVKYLDYALRREPLIRLKKVWSMRNMDCARMFGVTGPTIAKWLETRPPPRKALLVSIVGDASDILEAHLELERIPTVVRTRYEVTGGRSLMQLGREGRYVEMVEAARSIVESLGARVRQDHLQFGMSA